MLDFQSQLGNVQPLFHASSASSFVGILSSTILKYSKPSESDGTRLLVVCDIALGECKHLHKKDFTLASAPAGYSSVLGVRQTADVASEFQDDEYVVYNPSQVQIKYVVQFCVGEDQVNSFQPTVNVTNEETPAEAKYVFPLDETAAVCGFEAFINGKHVVGEVKEEEKARQDHRQAIQEGHRAYLMDQEAPDVFTISVGNLPPSATVLIKITYVTELATEFGSIVFRLPGSVAPWQQSKALNERTQKTQCKAVVITEENSSLGPGGFSLTIDLSEVYLPRMWVEKHPDKDSQACMLVFCPEFASSSFIEDCEVVIFLDSSNSMRGAVLQEARKIALRLLNSLHCKLNVVIFGTDCKELFPCPQDYVLEAAKQFIMIALQVIQMVLPDCSSVSVKWQQFNPNASQPVQALAQLHSVFSDNQLLVYGFVPHCTQVSLNLLTFQQHCFAAVCLMPAINKLFHYILQSDF
ncbi:Poly [ADP-ribose] polymerase 4 [Acipenser ruthenus]|uniref:Poly [ADP-ribose] polymerase n=1 Tax=Acipenser ruthenus TaxID=7906 RepID=A0A444UZN2_ACIRT|nr:Poly [ADP-ribose] polymerase 4 [Acipenser ruthenus]